MISISSLSGSLSQQCSFWCKIRGEVRTSPDVRDTGFLPIYIGATKRHSTSKSQIIAVGVDNTQLHGLFLHDSYEMTSQIKFPYFDPWSINDTPLSIDSLQY